MSKNTPSEELTVQQFAKELGVSHDVVTRMLHLKQIKGRRKNPFAKKSAFLIPATELERVQKLMSEGNGNGPSKSS